MNWDTTKEETEWIMEIVKRAKRCFNQARPGDEFDTQGITMDLIACHKNGCPLKLEALASADDFNLAHDVFGINRHLDRHSGKLTDCFSPRFSA